MTPAKETKKVKATGKPTAKTPTKAALVVKTTPKAGAMPPPPPSPIPSPAKPRTPKPKVVKPEAHQLKAGGAETLPVDVFSTTSSLAAEQDKESQYVQIITLKAGAAFSLVRTVMMTEGEFAGMQALLIRPAKPFPFLKLQKEVRVRVYRFYLAQKGIVDEPIVFDGKRPNKEPYAKTFADGSKTRIGLLTANKEICAEITPILYARTLKFESTTQLSEWVSQVGQSVRLMLRSIEIHAFTKTTSRLALRILAHARHLARLHIENGVSSNDDPTKAAKHFYQDAYKLLEAVGSTQRTPPRLSISPEDDLFVDQTVQKEKTEDEVLLTDGIDILSFGERAFTFKDAGGKATPWSKRMVEDFKEGLRAEMNS